MNRAFRLVEHRPADPDAEPVAVLYTVHLDGAPSCETDAFFHDAAVRAHPDFASVRVRYEGMHERRGLYVPPVDDPALGRTWLRGEGGSCVALCGEGVRTGPRRIRRTDAPVLRLYGLRLDRPMLADVPGIGPSLSAGAPVAVFGGGGVKTALRPADCPTVSRPFAAIHHVHRRLRAALLDGTVALSADGFSLLGDLDFPAQP